MGWRGMRRKKWTSLWPSTLTGSSSWSPTTTAWETWFRPKYPSWGCGPRSSESCSPTTTSSASPYSCSPSWHSWSAWGRATWNTNSGCSGGLWLQPYWWLSQAGSWSKISSRGSSGTSCLPCWWFATIFSPICLATFSASISSSQYPPRKHGKATLVGHCLLSSFRW